MKKLLLLFLILSTSFALDAQIPQAFSFQSLVTDSNNEPVRDQTIGVQVQILDGSMSGPAVYSETHMPSTNGSGLYTIEIGRGTNPSGQLKDVDWMSGNKYVALYHDLSGGTNYELVGSSQLLSVPYAMASGTSYIEPKIYVSRKGYNNYILDAAQETASSGTNFRYEWIQGEPEDVYIEYRNLPDNVHLASYKNDPNVSGPGQLVENISGVDTIYDGIILPSSVFKRTNPNQPLVEGEYPVEAIYRTETEVLKEFSFVIYIKDLTPPPAICTDGFGAPLTITETCGALQSLNGTVSEVEIIGPKKMTIKNFLNSGQDIGLTFELDDCSFISNDVFIQDIGDYTVHLLEFISHTDYLVIVAELTDSNGDRTECTLKYE